MKATGVVRKLDSLGRVVIPKSIREVNEWKEGQPFEFLINDNHIVLVPFESGTEKQEIIKSLEKSKKFIHGFAPELARELDDVISFLQEK